MKLKNGKVFNSKSVEKRVYRAAVSQRVRNIGTVDWEMMEEVICSSPYSMLLTLLYASHPTLCFSPYYMLLTLLYAPHPTICFSPYSMLLTLHNAPHPTLCFSHYSMLLTLLYASHLNLCSSPYSMLLTLLYASHPTHYNWPHWFDAILVRRLCWHQHSFPVILQKMILH
jgi:hypothetical protein